MKKLLALNRSEIAIRILRAANELGIRTVAIYSQEDRLALHRFKADEAYLIGEGKGPVEAYLDYEGIVDLAREKEVDAIHPGYGFLSENPELPRACERAGITFIGPSAELLELLGDKTAARRLAQKAGIPVVPGTEVAVTDPKQAAKVAGEIGFPLIVKAAFGGGGRGMRVVEKAADFAGRLEEARREAGAAFGNDAMFIERFVRRARHIEVQILGDRHGNILHLYERDCSVQRRHQKVVEVAPAVWLDPEIRAKLADAAVTLAKAAGYYNAGTVEFLVDADSSEWYFIEVNPRIQVEHTVTEMVTGIDLVRCQIQVAQGLALHGPEMNLPPQDQVPLNGYALQCRITTEDPANNFIPDYGKLSTYRSPGGFGIRLDGGSAYGGAVITPYYDSLLVKMTASGREFKHACQRMDRGLREFRVRGVKTNIPFLENVVNHPDFQAGRATTRWLEETPDAVSLFPAPRPCDQASQLPCRRDRQRQPDHRGQALPDAPADGSHSEARFLRAARRHPPAARPARARRVRRVGRQAAPPASHRHDLPRCAPVPARHARTHLRHAGDCELRFAPPARSLQSRNVGRRHFRRDHAVPARGSIRAPPHASRGDPQHLLPNAAARLERRRLHRISR